MAALATRLETQAGRPLTPDEIFAITRMRGNGLSPLLVLYITTGLVFMLLPGTFQVAAHESVRAVGCKGVLGALDVGITIVDRRRCSP